MAARQVLKEWKNRYFTAPHFAEKPFSASSMTRSKVSSINEETGRIRKEGVAV